MTPPPEPGRKLQKLSLYGFCSLLRADGPREVCRQTAPCLCRRHSASPEERKSILPISVKPQDIFPVGMSGIRHLPFWQPLRTGAWNLRMTRDEGRDRNFKEGRAVITKSRGARDTVLTHKNTSVCPTCIKYIQ